MAVKTTGARRETVPGEERRRQILDAAANVFAKQGYQRARTSEIAQRAGVAEGTIYKHFKSKEDLLLSLVGRVAIVSLPQVTAFDEAGDLGSTLTALLAAWLDNLDRNRELLKAVAPEIITHKRLREGYLQQFLLPTVGLFLPLLQQRLQTAKLRPFDLRVALAVFSTGALGALVVNEYLDVPLGRRLARQELIEEVVGLLLNGILASDGSARPAIMNRGQ